LASLATEQQGFGRRFWPAAGTRSSRAGPPPRSGDCATAGRFWSTWRCARNGAASSRVSAAGAAAIPAPRRLWSGTVCASPRRPGRWSTRRACWATHRCGSRSSGRRCWSCSTSPRSTPRWRRHTGVGGLAPSRRSQRSGAATAVGCPTFAATSRRWFCPVSSRTACRALDATPRFDSVTNASWSTSCGRSSGWW